MEIDIFSDTICPWCFIGKRRLERALAERPQPNLTITWRAFQLNPDMPAEGMERQRYLEVDFAFEAMTRTPNTIVSHRLIRHATQAGHQDGVVQALFDAYFLRGEDIGDLEVLTAAAEAGGLDAEAARAFLESDAEEQEVRAEDLGARRAGISGVPCFIFNRRHALAGAHPPEVLHQLFDLANQEEAAAAEA